MTVSDTTLPLVLSISAARKISGISRVRLPGDPERRTRGAHGRLEVARAADVRSRTCAVCRASRRIVQAGCLPPRALDECPFRAYGLLSRPDRSRDE